MSKLGDFFAAFQKNKAKEKEIKELQKGAVVSESAATQGNAGTDAKPEKQGGINNQTPEFRGRTINRKLVFVLFGVGIAAFSVSLMSFSQTGTKSKQTNMRVEKSDKGAAGSDITYSNIMEKERQAAGGGRLPNQTPGSNASSSGANPARQMSPSQARSFAAESAPLPSVGGNMSVARIAENAQEKKEAKAQADAFTAAISFSLAANPTAAEGNSAGASAVATTAVRETAVENALYAGTLLPAMLMNGVSSDLGGQLMAQITTDIYDSLHGDTLLIPMGSRLIGQYEAGAENGQSRVAVSWSLLILPDGSSYDIGGKLTSADGAGYPGIPGKVDDHEGKILTGGALSSAIAAIGSIAVGNTGSGDDDSVGKLAMEGAQANLLNSASVMFNKNLNIKPTITIAPGAAFAVQVKQTMTLAPYW